MNLEESIRSLVNDAVRDALERELPAHFQRLVTPPDPDKTYSYAEAAEYLGVTESCVLERVRAGELEAVSIGKYRKVPQRSITAFLEAQRARQQFERDQASVMPADVPPHIAALLEPASSPRAGVSNGKAQRKKRRA